VRPRSEIWEDIKSRHSCDVLILGSGINGAGLLKDLSLQGISCVLVDKSDFVAGTSSKSSRMIHGGLRYLENAEFKLVRESVAERNHLLRYAPHHVKPLKTSIPITSWLGGIIKAPLGFLGLPVKAGGRGALLVKLGLTFYDAITGKRRQTPKHFFTARGRSLRNTPGLRSDIVCTATYWDAWISQAERFCVDMIREACTENVGSTAINYVTVSKKDKNSVTLLDQASGEETTLQPEIVVNATGAWVDYANRTLGLESQFMGGTKGSHLVIDNNALYSALGDRMIYYEHDDGRVCIAFRFMDKVIMGSTDIKVGNPDDAVCEDHEVDYMMATLRGVFPDIEIPRDDIVFTFCGVRPLILSDLEYTGQMSRSHNIAVSEPDEDRAFRIYNMIGGKLTTFRVFAEETAGMILDQLGKPRAVSTEERPYLGAQNYPADKAARAQWVQRVADANSMDKERVACLFERYGTEAETLAEMKDPSWRTQLHNLPEYTVGEMRHLVQTECVLHLSDLVRRRSVITLIGRATETVLDEISEIVGGLLGWDEQQRKDEVAMALNEAQDGR
jgi:glycerol-3-phosphate dehydrogenase